MNTRVLKPSVADPGSGDENAEVGSEAWAQRARITIQGDLHRTRQHPGFIQNRIQSLLQHEGWKVLNKQDGSYFASFDEFCRYPEPYGLGCAPAQIFGLIEAAAPPERITLAKAKAFTIHPACLLFPLLSDDDLAKLAEDVCANGLLQPIVLLRMPDERLGSEVSPTVIRHWQMLDGRNRLRACELAGRPPHFVEWQGEGDPTAWVISTNLHRRHLTDFQRGELALSIKPMLDERARARQIALAGTRPASTDLRPNLDEGEPGRSDEQAAEMVGTSKHTVRKVEAISKLCSPGLIAMVRAEDASVDAIYMLRNLPTDAQEALAKVGPKAVKAKASELRKDKVGTGTARKKANPWAASVSEPTVEEPDCSDEAIAELPENTPRAPSVLSTTVLDALRSKGATSAQVERIACLAEPLQREVTRLAIDGLSVDRALARVDVPREVIAFASWLKALSDDQRSDVLLYLNKRFP